MNFNAKKSKNGFQSRNVGRGQALHGPRRQVSDEYATSDLSPTVSPLPIIPTRLRFESPSPPYREGVHFDEASFHMGGTPPSPIPAQPPQPRFLLDQPVIPDRIQQAAHAQGRRREVERRREHMPLSRRLRYYFAVDTIYVLKKLLLIMFPFTQKEWMVQYNQDTPVQPRLDINAPDLCIPSMGYVTYVLLAGFMLHLQHRFSPWQICIQAFLTLACIIFEMILYQVFLFIMNTKINLKTLDLLAYSGYKYPTMIFSLLAGLVLGKMKYYCGFIYSTVALSYFLIRTLRLQLLCGLQAPEQPTYRGCPTNYRANSYQHTRSKSSDKRLRPRYFLLFVVVTQPLMSLWLTYHLI